MSIQTQPLARSRADQLRFVDRAAEADALLRAIRSGRNALLLGDPGSGRTSLLNRVAWLLEQDGDPRATVSVGGELAQDAAQLLGVLVARTQRLFEPNGARPRWLDDLQALSLPDGPFGEVARPAVLLELVDLLAQRLAEIGRPVVFVIDGARPAVAHSLFGGLRNELWALADCTWVLAGDLAARTLYLEPPADAFFQETVTLRPLSADDAASLVRAQLPELSGAEVERAVAVGAGNARRLLRAADEIHSGLTPSVLATNGIADEAAAVAGPLAGTLVRHLATNGPAAASDPALLRELGASRQRASQLLHQLESAGLLQSVEQAQSGRPGRPAHRFALRERA